MAVSMYRRLVGERSIVRTVHQTILRQPGDESTLLDGNSPITAQSSNAFLDQVFWKSSVDQFVKSNPPVQYANLAVHAITISKQPSLILYGVDYGGQSARERALQYYGHALGDLAKAQGDGFDKRVPVVCSLMFVVFEIINDDLDSAEAHFKNGQRMVGEILAESTTLDCDEEESTSLLMQQLLQFLFMQSQNCDLKTWMPGTRDPLQAGGYWRPEGGVLGLEVAMLSLSPAMQLQHIM